jgi:hypothetical protein
MLEPKLFAISTIEEISRPRVAWGETNSPHPTLSTRYYGLGQVTTYYRGHRIVSHGGGLPGHHSLLLRMPDDDVGFAIFNNDETLGSQLTEIVCMKLIDELLGITDIVDWEEVYMLNGMRKETDQPPPPQNPQIDIDISGTYQHDAYGTLIVRRIEDHPMGEVFTSLLNEYPGNTIPTHPKAQIFIADFDHDLAGKLLLTSYEGQIFIRAAIKAVQVQPLVLEDERRYAGYVSSTGKCVVTREGIGMFEDFWGQGGAVGGMKIRQCVVENVEEEAEVWFSKVV